MNSVRKKRIQPVFVTVILIVIVLIAAIVILGFVFGLFGTSRSTTQPQIQAEVTSCVADGTTGEICDVVLTNSGNANTAATISCSLTYDGHTWTGVTSGPALGEVAAGNSAWAICTSNGAAGQARAETGSHVTGSVLLRNGSNVPFSATAS